ncbi:glutaminyl-peptide cyclotransferase [Amycolatopsis sp. CA-230715]|uniref:glutaminyl-peptide cyclotransferase n=1 Tax=Amycolatopsis sp. CA-230715 TaxID=2745196 RepID=UPI001C032F41|nr:glutaminyl-peptide cyclotransferase [Amycolatopsis sp. CA-230715]QWF81686.1 hypothetical protein HUW46_05119 [Amycolatopsis sp. CA-230715]
MRSFLVTALAVVLTLTGCAAAKPPPAQSPERLRVEVLGTLPHDATAFTEGLEFAGETLYEATGLAGKSFVTAGAPGQPARVRADLPAPLFGEGITVLGPTMWQLTWKDGIAIERDADTLAERRRVSYQGEGWGLCHRGDELVMSDGSSKLTFRDPRTFAETHSVSVHAGNRAYGSLNELECVGDAVYANVFETDRIVRIDPATGAVTAEIDASGLLTSAERATADVLNGIAAIPGTDEFLLAGKLWPKTFRVKLVPA